MSRFKNLSKYRHVQGNVSKKELWYPDLKPVASSGDYNSIAASAKWISVAWNTAGAIALLDVENVGKRSTTDLPMVFGHSTAITDLAFSPFNDSILATGSEDATVKLWKIPDAPTENLSTPTTVLSGHKKRIDTFVFHPSANNILATGSSDKSIKIWDLQAGKEAHSLDGHHGDIVHSIAWNYDGSLLASTSKDKKLRVIDPRSNKVVHCVDGHDGLKASRVTWLGDSQIIATTGFSKFRDRQFALWDAGNGVKNLSKTTIDSSTGVLEILYDEDTKLLFLAGKGDGGVRVYEFQGTEVSTLPAVQSSEPAKSSTLLPKRAMNLMNTEVVRILRLGTSHVAPISFDVPRKSKYEFQEELYPPTKSLEPAMTSSEWLGGASQNPKLIQLSPTSNPNKFWLEENQEPQPASDSGPAQTTSASSASSSQASPKTEAKKEPEPVWEPKVVQVVRASKYRHIGVTGTKPEDCYYNLHLAPSANNSVIRANSTYFCVPWTGAGGRVGVIPLSRTGKQGDHLPCIECGSDCLDFDFSPFDDSILSTVTESAHLQIWKIPEGGVTTDMRQPNSVLKGHTRRVTSVDFHPTVRNIVVTSAGDFTVRLWDLAKEKEAFKVGEHNEMVQSISWNSNGSLFASSCKDKFLRIVDPRKQSISQKVEAHDGPKGFKVSWMGSEEKVLTSGQSKSSERTLLLWDLRNLKSALGEVGVDHASGLLTPYYDADTGVVFTGGKGDGNMKMYEVNSEAPYLHYLTEFRSPIPANGITLLPKLMVDVKNCEIASWLRLSGDTVERLHFSVPRTRTEYFQDDIFPPTRNTSVPALEADQWIAGESKELSKVSLCPSGMEPLSQAPVEKKEKKYDFKSEIAKEDGRFSKEKFLDNYFKKMNDGYGEESNQVLAQDLLEGATAEEWD